MRKDKLKINFQRIGVLLCVCMVAFFGFLAPSVSASDLPQFNLPQRWLHDENPLDSPVFTVAFDALPGTYNFDFHVMEGFEIYECTSLIVSDLITGIDSYTAYNENTFVSSYYSFFVFLGDIIPESLNYRFCYLANYEFDWASPSRPISMYVFQDSSPYLVYYDSSQSSYFAYGSDGESFLIASHGQLLDSRFEIFDFVTPASSYSLFYLDSHEVLPSFLDRVTSGLTAVIGWVGAVASAVISGPLSPLLGLVAVGIAVSAILLIIYLVRRFIWGA